MANTNIEFANRQPRHNLSESYYVNLRGENFAVTLGLLSFYFLPGE